MTETISRSPLQWPTGWARVPAHEREHSRFGTNAWRDATSLATCVTQLMLEMSRMGVNENDVVISTNLQLRLDGLPRSGQSMPADPGVAVYWKQGGKLYNIACDKFRKLECNLWAIAKTIEADRGKERWGCITGDQRFTGYLALPATGTGKAWWTILGVAINATVDQVEAAFRDKAKKLHPDAGGSVEEFSALNIARGQALDVLRSNT